MAKVVSRITGVKEITNQLQKFRETLRPYKEREVQWATEQVHRRAKWLIGLRDAHTLEELARMGHPYAKRNPRPPHQPLERVHIQDLDLLLSLQDSQYEHTQFESTGVVGVDEGVAPHARWVLLGTSTMISRNFLKAALDFAEPKILKKFERDLAKIIGRFQ